MSGTYTLTAMNNICSVTETVSTLVVDYPVFTMIAPSQVCVGQTLSLSTTYSSNLATTYSWTGPGQFNSTLSAPVIPNVVAGANGRYNVVVETMGCVSPSHSVNVIVQSLPTISAAAVKPAICLNEKTTLRVKSNAVSFTWTPFMD